MISPMFYHPHWSANPSYHSGFFCHCSSCRIFHNKFVREIDVVGRIGAKVRSKTGRQQGGNAFISSYQQLQLNAKPQWIKIGDRVTAKGEYTGVVKFVGPLDEGIVSPQLFVGIQLDDPVGHHCGIINGKRYFETPKGRGMMVKYEEVTKRKPAEKCPPIQGNDMFPSFKPGKYTSLWANCDLGSPVNPTDEWKQWKRDQARARSAPPGKTAEEEDLALRAQVSWARAARKISMMFKLDDKGTQLNKPDQLPPKLLQGISEWQKDLGGGARAEQLGATLKKLHIAEELGRRELEAEQMKAERERLRQEREKKRQEALGS
ncbi:uncharacterized protein [Diadema antillarum]|uniref:uncharacterized protein n=1 Tax=Diadema antillarum TaxID=105358 RepID=UPI003A86EED2